MRRDRHSTANSRVIPFILEKSPNFADRERTNKNDTSGPHIRASPQTSFGVRLSHKRTPKDVCGESTHIRDFAIHRSFPQHYDFKEGSTHNQEPITVTAPSNRTLVTLLPSFSFHRKLNFYFIWVFTLEK